MPELDAVLTLSERSLGVMQPRPVTTLHVGGAITSDGGLTVQGPVTSSGLTVTGTTTVNGKALAVSPDANNTLVWNANGLFVPVGLNQATADSLYVNVAGDSMTGRLSMAGVDGAGIGSAGGSYGNPEITGAGGGAAKIAFHRPGAYAAYLGLDTDNQWAVGGWSMGAARYVLTTDTQTQTLTNKTITGSFYGTLNSMTHSGHLTMSGGYIFGSYVNVTADVAAGSPAYVAGQNGDNYIRWYPKSVVATTTSIGGSCGQIDLYDGNGWVEVNRLTAPRSGQGHVSATYRVARANGTYVSQAYTYLRLHFHNVQYIQSEIAGVPNGGDDRDGMVAVHWVGQISAGQICALEVYGGSCCGNFVRLHTGNITMTVGTN